MELTKAANRTASAAYYRLPKCLLLDPRYRGLSVGAMVLYALLLDRQSLSERNGWRDAQGRTFVYFTLEAVSEVLDCGLRKAASMLRELEAVGLIARKRMGQGHPTRIYVAAGDGPSAPENPSPRPAQKAGETGENCASKPAEWEGETGENSISAPSQREAPELPKAQGNLTEKNRTEYNNPESNQSGPDGPGPDWSGRDARARFADYFRWRLEWDYLLAEKPEDREQLEEILALLVDTVCSRRKSFTFGGETRPAEVVKPVLLDLTRWHVEYVLECLRKSAKPIRSVRAYLLTALYHAPQTMEAYYAAQARHLLSGKCNTNVT